MNKNDTALIDAFETLKAASAYKNIRWEALDKEAVDAALFNMFTEGWIAGRKHEHAQHTEAGHIDRTCEGFTDEAVKD